MIDQIVRDAVPDAKGGDPLLINWVPASGVVDVVVVGIVAGGGERLAVTTQRFRKVVWPS